MDRLSKVFIPAFSVIGAIIGFNLTGIGLGLLIGTLIGGLVGGIAGILIKRL